jgi:hypothetical protein
LIERKLLGDGGKVERIEFDDNIGETQQGYAGMLLLTPSSVPSPFSLLPL